MPRNWVEHCYEPAGSILWLDCPSAEERRRLSTRIQSYARRAGGLVTSLSVTGLDAWHRVHFLLSVTVVTPLVKKKTGPKGPWKNR